MSLNKSTGNMYPWVTHTWNPIQGRCPHQCTYCYMRRIWDLQKSEEQIFKEEYLKNHLGEGKTIFVGSSTDMWVGSSAWISLILNHCRKYPGNTYHFQTKDPQKMIGWIFPPSTIIGTTIETDNQTMCEHVSPYAPSPAYRALSMLYIKKHINSKIMINLEPLLDFNLYNLWVMLKIISPNFISIGADSKGNNLPEPKPQKIKILIKELKKFTTVKTKSNLMRLIGDEEGFYA